MLRNYLLVALRNIRRHPLFSFINIFGLALSLSFCLLVVVVMTDQGTFDAFHEDPEDVYRVLTNAHRKNGDIEPYASSPQPLGQAIATGSASVASYATLVSARAEAETKNEAIRTSGFFADERVFGMFRLDFKEGQQHGSLDVPGNIVLTASMAVRLFGDAPAVGRSVTLGELGVFDVVGVIQPLPGKTHLEFDFLLSSAVLPALEKQGAMRNITGSWNNYYESYTYVRLQKGAAPQDLAPTLARISETSYAGLPLETRDAGYSFELQPLLDITPGRNLSNNMGNGIPEFMLDLMTILALIGMTAAVFNYTMLTLARSLSRAREVGIRKVSGAVRSHLFAQFVLESVVVMGFSLLAGDILLRTVLIPGFGQMQMTSSLDISLALTPTVYVSFIALSLMIGILSGVIPATVLSGLRPAVILKDVSRSRVFSRLTIRKALIVVQFVLSLTMVIILTIMTDQIRYSSTYEYDFRRDHVLSTRLQGTDYSKFASAIVSSPGVLDHAAISHHPGTWEDWKEDVRVSGADEWTGIRTYSIDARFIPMMSLDLVAGKNFNDDAPGLSRNQIVVNEEFLKRFELGAPLDAIGKTVSLESNVDVRIAGVLKDFLYKPLVYSLEPVLFVYRPDDWRVALVQADPNQSESVMAHTRSVWQDIDPSRQPRIEWFNDILERVYSSFDDIIAVVGFLAVMAVAISFLGLLGIVTLNAESRVKEVGIRKVLGASVLQLVLLLSKREAILLGLAVVIAVPVALLVGDQLLTQFAYRIALGPAVVIPGVLFVLLVAACIVGAQTFRASRVNPVKTIHYE